MGGWRELLLSAVGRRAEKPLPVHLEIAGRYVALSTPVTSRRPGRAAFRTAFVPTAQVCATAWNEPHVPPELVA